MPYTVTIAPPTGQRQTFQCGGATDQEALVYAGKIVEGLSDRADGSASVIIERDGEQIGPETSIADMLNRSDNTI